jgi:hypothetical protein
MNKTQREQSNGCFGLSEVLLTLGVVLLWSFAGSLPASSQAVYGAVFGTVTDKSGAAVPGATITVTDVSKGTSVAATTNETGAYRVQHLIPDTYSVQAEANGFSKSVAGGIVVYADTAPEVNLQLAVGAVSNSVTVSGGSTLLEVDRAEVTTILDERAVENLPNMNRNFTEFELLTPGTTYIGWGPGEGGGNPQRSGSIEVDGQLPFATGYELDGTDNQEPLNGVAVINPNLDAVSEMKVTAQNYDAEFGKAVAGLVTAQTKSGTNSFHGTAFEYRRSDAQQARDPFANAPPNNTLPATLHNQLGGSVGGPIRKERLFFFGDVQALREKTGASTLTTVPTLKAEQSCTAASGNCDLSDYISGTNTLQAYKPLTLTDTTSAGRTPYAGNLIPVGQLSPAAVAFFKLLPAPNAGAAGATENNFAANGSGIFNTDQSDVRVDYRVSEKLHLFGRYTYFTGALSGAPYFGQAGGLGFGPGGFAGTDAFHYSSLASGGDYMVSPRWLTDFRFGYYNIYNNTQGPNANQPLGNNLGIPNANIPPLSLNGGMPQFNIDIPANGANGGQNVEYGTSAAESLQQTSQYQFVNNWSHSLGNHNIKFGVDYRLGKNNSLAESGSGNVNFDGTYFFHASRTEGGVSPGLGFATFLLGDTTNYWRTVSNGYTGKTTQDRIFMYVQDQWRATPKISLSYGLRWEIYTPESVTKAGTGGLLNIETGNVDIAGVGSFNHSINVQNNLREFAPRLGATYQVRPDTVVRAGYGIVYGQGWAGNTFGDTLTGSIPVQVQQDQEPVANTAAVFNLTAIEGGVSPGPPGFALPAIPSSGAWPLPNGISQNTRPLVVRLPTVQGWNLTVEHQFSPTLALQVAYVGSEAYHNMFDSSNQFQSNQQTVAGFEQINPNNPTYLTTGNIADSYYTVCEREPLCGDQYGTAQSLFGVRFGTPHGWTQQIDDNYNEATESYNALQVIMNKRVSAGLSFLSHYTWSHALAHESYEFAFDPRIGKGNSYYNRRQAFVFAGDYDLPFGRGKHFGSSMPAWTNEVVGGFQLNGTLAWDGGLPFTPTYGECSQDEDAGVCFLNRTGLPFGIHKGKFNAQNPSVPYLETSPQPLAMAGQPGSSWGAYQRPPIATVGNIGRDSLWGPGLVDVDSSLTKSFNLVEGVRFQLIVQAFNLFNHVNYGGPNNCIDCGGSAGLIQGTLSNQYGTSLRFLQFASRLSF